MSMISNTHYTWLTCFLSIILLILCHLMSISITIQPYFRFLFNQPIFLQLLQVRPSPPEVNFWELLEGWGRSAWWPSSHPTNGVMAPKCFRTLKVTQAFISSVFLVIRISVWTNYKHFSKEENDAEETNYKVSRLKRSTVCCRDMDVDAGR